MTLSQVQSSVILLAALLICWHSLPSGRERRWVLLSAAFIGSTLGALVIFGDPGTVTKYLADYYLLTTACMIASGMGCFAAIYLALFHDPRRAIAPFALALYLMVDVAANALYRRTEYVYDFQRLLQAGVHVGHLVVFVGVGIWGMRRGIK